MRTYLNRGKCKIGLTSWNCVTFVENTRNAEKQHVFKLYMWGDKLFLECIFLIKMSPCPTVRHCQRVTFGTYSLQSRENVEYVLRVKVTQTGRFIWYICGWEWTSMKNSHPQRKLRFDGPFHEKHIKSYDPTSPYYSIMLFICRVLLNVVSSFFA